MCILVLALVKAICRLNRFAALILCAKFRIAVRLFLSADMTHPLYTS